MKNLMLAGALALTTACLAGDQASAWINSQFGMGMNWNWASGGNCLGWGLFRDGQPGGPDIYHSFGQTPVYPQGPGACAPTYPTIPAPAPAPAPAPHHHHAANAPIPVPAVAPATNASQSLYRAPYHYYQRRY